MRYLPFVLAFATLVPSSVYAQNQQISDCHSLEAAGYFVGADEALVNGMVCKVSKPKANSAAQVAGQAAERSMALLGVIEPETLRSKEKAGASSVGGAPAPGAAPGSAASDCTANGDPQSSFFATPEKSLGEIARAYRKEAGTRTTTEPEKGGLERKKPTDEVARVPALSPKTPAPARVAELQPAGRTQIPPAAEPPTAARRAEIIAPAPATVLSTVAEAPRTAKNEVIAVPQAQPNAVKHEASPASTRAPEVHAPAHMEMIASAQGTPAKELTEASPVPSAREEAPEPERSLRVGVFAVSQPPATDPSPQPLADATAEDSAFREGQVSTCIKNVSLGSMDKEKLFLAIPEWALKWHAKNQKRFPRICFSDSLMPGAQNYLVVFYTAAPLVAGTESLAKISAPGEMAPVAHTGGFTISDGSTWHYTYEGTVTTTITSLSADKAPHNQPSTVLYATAYSEQGIPISHHWQTPATKPDKKTSTKPGKSRDVLPPEFRRMEELLDQMVADIAKR